MRANPLNTATLQSPIPLSSNIHAIRITSMRRVGEHGTTQRPPITSCVATQRLNQELGEPHSQILCVLEVLLPVHPTGITDNCPSHMPHHTAPNPPSTCPAPHQYARR
nr:MAG TPA: hypothetical protein [Caudoviricetes sp.]DAN46194.1 MAG TPA: hypothetical protein [Caudoviricetes sp.]DAS53816.1 MAG TPA: hypothetical protein [Caudoviricetes sp.]DAY14020.1 MAG TPA: hypothetical protein [Caudoviricetes sp.]